ncbi:hypothetical protein [Roseovarius nitratireducens]|nr:hypothetical protein [Roseovarius nitratireducens]
MSFNDLTKKTAALDKAKSDKKPEKETATKAPNDPPRKPAPKV